VIPFLILFLDAVSLLKIFYPPLEELVGSALPQLIKKEGTEALCAELKNSN
tara:strand:- start:6216 stop:6368 length:153 start_codon:yes stop_codon:yes gene_type:complete